uniref:Uncharacterized protein n=1 Tax=Spongospora subterranea TaxID=70186 RepID=A0A0H5RA00_9EUKA|eukprot:CRZ10965.1 hypothetical protein [Spongospora subterranea]
MLRRVVIYERASGVCLFSESWGQWKGDQSRGKICGLVQFFYQLAREIENDGEVSRVTFQESAKIDRPRSSAPFHSRFASLPARASKRSGGTPSMGFTDSHGLNMTCADHEQLVAAVFYEDDPDVLLMQNLANQVLEKFTEKYQTQIDGMASIFDNATKIPDFVVDEDAVMAAFLGFSEAIENLRRNS